MEGKEVIRFPTLGFHCVLLAVKDAEWNCSFLSLFLLLFGITGKNLTPFLEASRLWGHLPEVFKILHGLTILVIESYSDLLKTKLPMPRNWAPLDFKYLMK